MKRESEKCLRNEMQIIYVMHSFSKLRYLLEIISLCDWMLGQTLDLYSEFQSTIYCLNF